jgi:nitrite reductase/ring-hydroxylating ferredoxin subunit
VSWHRVASRGDLAPGEVRAIEVEGRAMVLARDGDAYYATQRACLHQGGDLADGIVSRGLLICPVHGWKFAVATGVHEISPETFLVTYAVRIEGDDVLVDPTPRPTPRRQAWRP